MEYSLKITGAASIPEALEADKAIYIITELDCYAAEKRNKQDGSYEIVYKTKLVGAAELRQGEKKQISKNKTKASQRLRQTIESRGRGLGVEDLEEYYQEEINKIISNINEV